MATVNGARAAGFDGQIGSLTVGTRADLVLLDLRASYYHPRNDLLAQLVHCETGSSVDCVLVDGRVIVRDGRLTTVDEAALLAEADEIGRRVSDTSASGFEFTRRLQPYLRAAYRQACATEWPVNRYASTAYRALAEA